MMVLKAADDNELRKYVLGDMSGEEQHALEVWLISDEEACDRLAAAEDDLIDDWLAGKLDGHQMDSFQDYFLIAPERQRKLHFSRIFRRFLASRPAC